MQKTHPLRKKLRQMAACALRRWYRSGDSTDAYLYGQYIGLVQADYQLRD